jgi:hypothetical protein
MGKALLDVCMVVFPISLVSLVLVAVMERILPYRREWNRSHGDLRTDALYYLTQIFVGGLLAPRKERPCKTTAINSTSN